MTDINEYLTSLDDDTLKAKLKEAVEDLNKAASAEPNSEWHGACFAAVLMLSGEMSKRGIKAVTVH